MYTLEDDEETSSRLKKQDIASARTQLSGAGAGSPKATVPLYTSQISSSFKKLTTPGRTSAGNQKVALAALTVACIAVFFTALDQTVVVTALPQIISDLQVPITQLDHAAWIISAYLLGFVVVMPLMGRVSDIYGRRRIFLLCLVIFGSGSIMCALAPLLGQLIDLGFLHIFGIDTSSPGLIWLIAARFIQAIGGGAVVPVAMAIAGDFYGPERRGLALGIVGAVTEAGGVLGPLYGAVIVQHLGWQYIFYFNVPVVVALMIAASMLLPRSRRLRERIDWLGTILLALALTCLSLGLAQQGTQLGPSNGPAPQNNPIALALSLIFLVAFVLVERKRRWPVVELSLFKRLPFVATAIVSLLIGAALMTAMADIPIFVDTVLQLPVLDSGLALLRLTAMIPLGAFLGGWLCSRITCRVTGVIGLLFTAAGFYLMSLWPVHVDWTQITISTMLAGFGFGLVIAPIGTTAINAVRARQAGSSSSVVTALRMLGMTLGLAALTSWALAYFKQLAAQYPSLPTSATVQQFSNWQKGYAHHLILSAHTVYCAVFFASMILCLIAIIPATFMWGRKLPVSEVETDEEPEIYEAITSEIDLFPNAAILSSKSPGNWWHDKKRRKKVIILASIGMLILLLGGGFLATWFLPDDSTDGSTATGGTNITSNTTGASGPRRINIALDQGALTSIFAAQLGQSQSVLSNLNASPMPNNGLVISLNLHIDTNGIHRIMAVEMDGSMGLSKQQNLQYNVQHLKRDGIDAGPAAAAQMQAAMNELLASSIMPALHQQLKNVKLLGIETSNTVACGKGAEMFVLQLEAPPIQGIAAQSAPLSLCLNGATDINKLLSH